MSNKKRYIFITNGISELGGVELYLVNKIQWLEKNNWDVHVFSAHFCFKPYKIEQLRKYKKENIPPLAFPPYAYSEKNIYRIISRCKKHFKSIANETIVESHSGSTALWGELLAKELRARHHIEFLHEYFNEECYFFNKDYFIFKLNRHEIFCGQNAKNELIEKILNDDPNKAVKNAIQYNPVLDIECKKIKKIQKADFTICYLGRTDKSYFPYILSGVSDFARNHKESIVQLVIIGKRNRKVVMHYLGKPNNVHLVELGEMFPIPKKIYNLVDCVCAGAGSARCSVMEGKPVIVPNPNSSLANGVLGYDTNESVASDPNVVSLKFCDIFESVLIRKDYLTKKFKYPIPLSVDECCIRNMELIHQNGFDFCYYGLEKMAIHIFKKKYIINAWLDLRFPALKSIKSGMLRIIKRMLFFVPIDSNKNNKESLKS